VRSGCSIFTARQYSIKSDSQIVLTRSQSNHIDREATLAYPILKTLAADLLWLGDILPVDVGSVMFKSCGRHSHHIAVDSLYAGLQKKNFHSPINGQPVGENTAGCASSNWIKSTLKRRLLNKFYKVEYLINLSLDLNNYFYHQFLRLKQFSKK